MTTESKSNDNDARVTPALDADRPQAATQSVVTALTRHVLDSFSEPIAPGLYLVATPIGNLSDITLRALHVLAKADQIYCEDTRHSRTLMERFGITTALHPYHEHNAARQRPGMLKALAGGARIALISDAGTPLISDPGFKIVREAVEAGHSVTSIPGPSAALTAITSSGLATDTLLFAGFLPAKATGRRKRIQEFARTEATLIFFEAPHRLAEALGDLLAELGDRPACVARELTKLHEQNHRGTLSTLHKTFEVDAVKGECVIVVGPPEAIAHSDEEISELLATRLESASLKDTARALADELGVPKSRVYDLGLALKRRQT